MKELRIPESVAGERRLLKPARPAYEDPARVAAWIPVYTEKGDAVRICYADGQCEEIGLSMRSLLRRTAAHSGADPALLRGGRLYRPLPLEHTVFLPCKMRRPRCPRDNTLGYANLLCIRACYIAENPARCRLDLDGEHTVDILWRERTMRRHIEEAMLLLPHHATDPLYPLALHLAELLRALMEYRE